MSLLQKIINIISENSSSNEEDIVEETVTKKTVEESKKVEIKKKYVLPPMSLIYRSYSPDFYNGLKCGTSKLSFKMKKYGSNEYETIFINEMPNLLIGGTLISGKTSLINNIICSLLMTTKPDEVKFVLVDTKRIELSVYDEIPYLLAPIQSDYMRVQAMLKRLVGEMERRYDLLRETKNRNIETYNSGIENYNKNVSEEDRRTRGMDIYCNTAIKLFFSIFSCIFDNKTVITDRIIIESTTDENGIKKTVVTTITEEIDGRGGRKREYYDLLC